MTIVLLSVVAIVFVAGLAVFLRAVFGGSTFRGESRRTRDEESRTRPPGDRADANPGTRHRPGGGGTGTWNTWSGGGP
jgi:hypothetical protein